MTKGTLESTDVSSFTNSNSSPISSVFMFQFLSHQMDEVAARVSAAFSYSVHALSQLPAKLHSSLFIYGFYGLLDGVNTAFGTLKYVIDVHCANTSVSSTDVLRDFLVTPEGIAIVVIESLVLAGCAFAGNVFENDGVKHTGWEKLSAIFWRYLRDALKALKNAYKGIRNLLVLWSMIAGQSDVLRFILPIGLALGVFSALNRMFIRYMRERRKDKTNINEQLIKEINALKLAAQATPKNYIEELHHLLNGLPKTADNNAKLGMQTQSLRSTVIGYAAAIYNSFLDAPYLILGLVSLAVLSWPLFITLTTFCVFFLSVCIATRIFEEYNDQRLLLISQTKLQLAACLAEIKYLSQQLDSAEEGADTNEIVKSIFSKFSEAIGLKEKLQQQSVLSTTEVVLGGLLNGMNAFQSLTSMAFAVSSLCLILAMPYPVLLLMSLGPIGIVFLIGFVSLALTKHWKFLEKNPVPKSGDNPTVKDILARLKNPLDTSIEEIQAITDDIVAIPVHVSPQTFFEKITDIFRLFWSGLGKGFRIVDATARDGDNDHSSIVAMVAWVAAGLYAIVYTLRGFARLGKANNKDKAVVEPVASNTPSSVATTASDDESDEQDSKTPRSNSPESQVNKTNTGEPQYGMKKANSDGLFSRHGFFMKRTDDDADGDAYSDHCTSLADDRSETSECSV